MIMVRLQPAEPTNRTTPVRPLARKVSLLRKGGSLHLKCQRPVEGLTKLDKRTLSQSCSTARSMDARVVLCRCEFARSFSIFSSALWHLIAMMDGA
ncbi:hypothetical protein Micbo1qcDRAFT_17547 [Microdochium bolleyi]|uniref:Uncharacterized protein n=1 Tax=Microdochium bolleyi TaxID=196109 RepID=A0A136ITW4_9PEZI|nr:hypothetical protein Micbo1qcDRAFT_17547 [Microdochium bolleyi]